MIRIADNLAARRLAIVCLAAVLLYSCQGSQPADPPSGIEGSGGVGTAGTSAGPTIASLGPNCVPRGEQALNPNANSDLYVVGQNFLASSVVRWNGIDLPTTFLSSTQLAAQVAASDIAAVGTAAITVFNPGANGGSSNTATFTVTAGEVAPTSIAIDPAGQFAYVANEGCGNFPLGYISQYTIDGTTGALASLGPPMPANDAGAISVAVSPDGRFVYAANWGEGDLSGSVSAFTLNATTGLLTFTAGTQAPCEPPPTPGSCAPWTVAVHPSGKFVYVANEGGFAPTSISMYAVDPGTGILKLIGLAAAVGRAFSVAMHPSGTFAYVAEDNGNVSTYVIDTTTGVLTRVGTVGTGSSPPSIAIHPSGKFAYATSGNNVWTFSIDATTGVLTVVGAEAASSGSIAVHPSGGFAYVVNTVSNDVSTYTVDLTTGALTSRGSVATGLHPSAIAVHPSGKFAYVTNSDSNDVSIYSINAVTGVLTLMGSIGT